MPWQKNQDNQNCFTSHDLQDSHLCSKWIYTIIPQTHTRRVLFSFTKPTFQPPPLLLSWFTCCPPVRVESCKRHRTCSPQFYKKQPLQHSGSYRPFPPSGPDWILLHRGIGLFYAKKINPPDPLLTAVTLEASLLVFVVTVVHQFGSTYFRCKS